MDDKSSSNIPIARQPIVDRDGEIFGYELLYRGSHAEKADIIDGSAATSELVLNSFFELDINDITNGKHAFINLTRDYITGEIPIPFGPENVVLEILEDITVDSSIIKGTQSLVERGYTIALDDFMLDDKNRDLIPLAQIIKVDVISMSAGKLISELARMKQYSAQMLAEKVETREDYQRCLDLGFDFFQGYFLSRPVLVKG